MSRAPSVSGLPEGVDVTLVPDVDLSAFAPVSRIMPPGTIENTLERLYPKPSPYFDDPVRWVNERIGEFIWSKQREVAQAVATHRQVGVQSCHGTGKTRIASRISQWWLDSRPKGQAFVVTTAPTAAQVQTVLWREIRALHDDASLDGRVTLDARQYDTSDRLVALGRKPADHNQAAFQGYHAKYVLVIIDEACGVPKSLYDALSSLITGRHCKVLAIGNPDDPSAHFAQVMKPGSEWHKIKISAFDSPAFTGEPVPEDLLDLLIGPTWVEEKKRDWGEESPTYVAKVLGEFPDISDDTLLPPKLLRMAMDRDLSGEAALTHGRYALDVARKGSDSNALARNRAGMVRIVDTWGGLDLMATANRLDARLGWSAAGGHKNEVGAIIDTIGVGAGVYDRCRERDLPVRSFNASERAYNDKRFANRRAEVYWEFREGCERGTIDLPAEGTFEADDQLIAELGSVKYTYDNRGRILMEKKEDHRKRLGHSPDRADAAVMTLLRGPAAGKDRSREMTPPPYAPTDHDITAGLMEEAL